MASDNTIREFLVALGWDNDEASQRRFVHALEGATLRAKLLGDTIEGTAIKIRDSVASAAEDFERLYWTTQYSKVGAENLKSLEYAFSQVGLSGNDAASAIALVNRKMQENPGNRYFLKRFGFYQDAVTKQIQWSEKMAEDGVAKMSDVQFRYWMAQSGLPENVGVAIRQQAQAIAAAQAEYKAALGRMGGDPEQWAADGQKFKSSWRDLLMQVGVLGSEFNDDMQRALTGPIKSLDEFLKDHEFEIAQAIKEFASAFGAVATESVKAFEAWEKDPKTKIEITDFFNDAAKDARALGAAIDHIDDGFRRLSNWGEWFSRLKAGAGYILNPFATKNPFSGSKETSTAQRAWDLLTPDDVVPLAGSRADRATPYNKARGWAQIQSWLHPGAGGLASAIHATPADNQASLPAKGRVTAAQAAQLALSAGATPLEAELLGAISQAESSGNPRSHNTKYPDNSYGLWQVNMLGAMGPERMRQFGLKSPNDLFDPKTNARVALAILRGHGGARNWSTYSSGAYRRYLAASEEGLRHPASVASRFNPIGSAHAASVFHPSNVSPLLDSMRAQPPLGAGSTHNDNSSNVSHSSTNNITINGLSTEDGPKIARMVGTSLERVNQDTIRNMIGAAQ